ncbi:MAG TPA: type III PLP-dependent enzyme [Candidatus Sulfotelmatobacter sp.]|jgi:ornithine decarboxylase|nr:type III PLP-dependent enzyme [Candidatus Sulfotelmatobacter sp.]
MNVYSFARAAVPPLDRPILRRRAQSRYQGTLPAVTEVVQALRPDDPVMCLRPATLRTTARNFVEQFPGDALYAVKCNPELAILRGLWDGGVRHFDAASMTEVKLVRGLFPDAHIHFMHPIKSRPAIAASYALGVRDYVIDSLDELDKVLEETPRLPVQARDLGLLVRLSLPKGDAVYDLSGKFGAPPAEAAEILRLSRKVAVRVGLCFHVGSQCMNPAAYETALALGGQVIAEAGVPIDIVDVGGGFPVSYADMVPPALSAFVAAIRRGYDRLGLSANCRLWCEPGRALVAPAESLVVRVTARRERGRGQIGTLFINDGVFGALSDAGASCGLRFPARLIRDGGGVGAEELLPFELFGPTCDSADRMRGPFMLPADVREGDWIEIGQLGAYGSTLRTGFNGFGHAGLIEVRDQPLMATPGYLEGASKAA